MSTKQVLVVRKDLNMRKGKIAAQCAHASIKVFLDRAHSKDPNLEVELTPEMKDWLNGAFTKVVVSVSSEEELLDVYDKAEEFDIPCSLVVDSGRTEFDGVPTKTVAAIGPAKVELVDKVTKSLKLM